MSCFRAPCPVPVSVPLTTWNLPAPSSPSLFHSPNLHLSSSVKFLEKKTYLFPHRLSLLGHYDLTCQKEIAPHTCYNGKEDIIKSIAIVKKNWTHLPWNKGKRVVKRWDELVKKYRRTLEGAGQCDYATCVCWRVLSEVRLPDPSERCSQVVKLARHWGKKKLCTAKGQIQN